MNGLNYTNAEPYRSLDGWEVLIPASENLSIKKDDVLQTGTYAFYVDDVKKQESGALLCKLTPKH